MTRFTAVVISLGFVAGACDGPTRPSPSPADASSPSPTSPPAANSLQALAGSYDLKVALSDTCTDLAETARQRTYRATLEATYGYLGVRLTGGGYSAPIVVGEVWPGPSGAVTINWNNFDIEGCDGYPESLPDGSELMICGGGAGVRDESGTLSIAFSGGVLLRKPPGEWRAVCSGGHQFTFTKQ
jgi:hypothetical protein